MDTRTHDLFASSQDRPGSLGCAIEIAATISDALDKARMKRNLSREDVAERMSYHLGERLSVHMINAYTAQSHDHEISLRRAMAFHAALDDDVLLNLYCQKRGGRVAMGSDDAALLEWARLHHQERELAERRKALEAALKVRSAR